MTRGSACRNRSGPWRPSNRRRGSCRRGCCGGWCGCTRRCRAWVFACPTARPTSFRRRPCGNRRSQRVGIRPRGGPAGGRHPAGASRRRDARTSGRAARSCSIIGSCSSTRGCMRSSSAWPKQQRFGAAETRRAAGGAGQPGIRRDPQRAAARAVPAAALRRPVDLRRVCGRLPGHSLLPAVPDGQFLSGAGSLEKVDAIIARDIAAETFWRRPACPARPSRRNSARRHVWRPRPLTPIRWERFPIMRRIRIRREREAPWARGRQRSEQKYLLWSQRAQRQAARGNRAGAAIRRARAEFWAPASGPRKPPPPCGKRYTDWSIACKRPWASKTQKPRPWREALLALAHQTPRDCGPSRPGCSTTCKRSASTRSGRPPRSTSCSGSCRWGGGRSAASCPTSAWCS